jgi:hypothetical protein
MRDRTATADIYIQCVTCELILVSDLCDAYQFAVLSVLLQSSILMTRSLNFSRSQYSIKAFWQQVPKVAEASSMNFFMVLLLVYQQRSALRRQKPPVRSCKLLSFART